MSREADALAAVRTKIPDDTIREAALAFPRGQTATVGTSMVLGAALGAAGGGRVFVGVGEAVGYLGARAATEGAGHAPASIVLALSDTALYTLARDRQGLVGGWKSMTPMVRFELDTLDVRHERRGVLVDITLHDTTHDVTVELESKLLGNMGINDLLRRLDERRTEST